MTSSLASSPSIIYVLPRNRPPKTRLSRLCDWWEDATGRNTFNRRFEHIVDALRIVNVRIGPSLCFSAEEVIEYLGEGTISDLAAQLAGQGIGRQLCPELIDYLTCVLQALLDDDEVGKHGQ